jgi:deoxyadenosine/deoxycytidine kinase
MVDPPDNSLPLIGIVGPCGAGKTTLAGALARKGWNARAIGQEHSYVKDMWQRLTRPDVLIFLQVSWKVGGERRSMNWSMDEWKEQQSRLSHALNNANFSLDTTNLNKDEVLLKCLKYLRNWKKAER